MRELRRQNVDAEITVIAQRDELHYLPSAIWIPSGLRKPSDLKVPLAQFFAAQRAIFIQAAVTGIADGGRTVRTDEGEFRNDQLVIATGGFRQDKRHDPKSAPAGR